MVIAPRSWVVGVVASVLVGCSVPEYAPPTVETRSAPQPDPDKEAPEPCAPVTCAEAQATCGEVPDGCGGFVQCEQCTEGTRCGALKTCEPIRPLWGRTFEAGAHAVFDDAGNVVVLVTGTPMSFLRFTTSGALIDEQTLDAGTRISQGFFRIGDDGARFFVFNRSCGAGCSAGQLGTPADSGWTAIRVSKQGSLQWAQALDGEVRDVETRIGDDLLVLTAPTWRSYQATLVRIAPDGVRAGKRSIEGAHSIATDSSGHLIVGGLVRSSEATPQGRAFISKLAPGGDAVWTRTSGGEATASVSLVSAVDGTLVANITVTGGAVEWDGESFSYESQPGTEARSLFLQLDEHGTTGWTRFHYAWGRLGAASSPSNFAAAVPKSENCWNLKTWGEGGANLWSAPIGAGCESPHDVVNPMSIAAGGGLLAVAGSFGGEMDFGDGPVASHGGFLQVHEP